METKTMTDGKTSQLNKMWLVELWKYPERIYVHAKDEQEARKVATDRVDFSVWESKAEEVD